MLHDGIKALEELFGLKEFPRDNEGILRNFQVLFGGTKNDFDKLRTGLLLRQLVSIRPDVVYMWLRALKHLHPDYYNILIEDTPEEHERLKALPELFLKNMRHISNETLLNNDMV